MGQPDARISVGNHGEELACAALTGRGYAIVARRYRTRCGELDIVARDGRTLVFVEVKARIGITCGTAREAVTARKRRQVILMAIDYLARHRVDATAVRFDVVAITRVPGRAPDVEIIPNAFDLNDV